MPEQKPSIGLYPVRKSLTNPVGHVAVLNLSDSNGEYRDERWIGGVRGVYDGLTHKRIVMSPNTGAIGGASGAKTTVIQPPGSTVTNVDPGDSIVTVPGVASAVYPFPCDAIKFEWTSEPTVPHFSRLILARLTHGAEMQDASGATGANYASGDPTLNRSLTAWYSYLANPSGASWGMEIRTDIDPEGNGGHVDLETTGYPVDGTVPADEVGLKLHTRDGGTDTAAAANTEFRIRNTPTDEGSRLGNQIYVGPLGYDVDGVTNGVSFWTVAVGGWGSSDHMEPSVGGTPNPDSKYTNAAATAFLQNVVQADSVVIRIQIGQNALSSGDFAEGSGTNTGNYKSNVENIISRWRTICSDAGVTPYFYLVSTQNTIAGGARMEQMATDLSEIAAAASDVGFFDLRGSLIDADLTDPDQRMKNPELTSETGRIHTNQNGMFEFARLEWTDIQAATSESSGGSPGAPIFFALRRRRPA